MKILQVLPSLNFGGVEVGTIDMAKALLHRGHQPYVMSSGGKLVEELHKLGVQHYELPVHQKSVKALALVPKIEGIINREKIDIVHARSRIPAWLAYLATRRTGARFITTCHGYYSTHFLSRVMGWGEKVIVISSSIGRHMMDHFDVPAENVRLVHRGLDIEKYPFDLSRFQSVRKKKKDKYVIANIARITPIKGHKDFLKAIRLACRHLPPLEVWLIGSEKEKPAYYQDLVQLIDKLGLKDTVRFLGSRKDIPQLLTQVDLLVLSTTIPEGFGRVLLEAGASGVPVVSTAVGGVLDVIEPGQEGLLVPPNEPVRMSEAIIEVIGNYADFEEMAVRFRRKIEKLFTLDKMAERTLAVYEESLKKKKILVHKLGALGDLILVVPSLRALRRQYPQAEISLLVDQNLAPLMESCPYVDELITFDRKKRREYLRRTFHLIHRIRRKHFHVSIDFQNNKWTHLISYLGDVRSRFGYARGIWGWMLTGGLHNFKEPLPPVEHQLRILNLLGISGVDPSLELWTTEEDQWFVQKLLEEAWMNPSQALVGFVLNASSRWKTKSWPLEHFVLLAERLERELSARILLIGDNSQKPVAEKFLLQTNTATVDFVGKTSLRQMVALIARLSCLVSGDTAPLHVASAVKAKSVALFGPTDPKRHAPPGGKARILKSDLYCMPCYRTHCNHPSNRKGEAVCMKNLTVEQVFQEVKRCLNEQGSEVHGLKSPTP